MEEVLDILEESDRAMQASLRALEGQFADLAAAADKQAMGLEETNKRLDRQSDHLNSELQRAAKTQQDMVSELFLMFDAKLEKVTEQLNQQAAQSDQQAAQLGQKIDSLSNQTTNSIQSLVNDFAERIQDVTRSTSANGDRIVEQMETRLARAETYADKENRRHIAAFADGFSELADRFLALRSVQAS
jgi:DNA anti-recombination protein RmuC